MRLTALLLLALAACATTSKAQAPAEARLDCNAVVPQILRAQRAGGARLERGVRQVCAQWRPEDGDQAALQAFVSQWYVADEAARDTLRERFTAAFEQLDGHLLEIGRALRSWNELEIARPEPVDELFAAFDPSAHVSEDLFTNKLAFVVLLNFPLATLDEMTANAKTWSRRDWAEVRLARRFALRPNGAAAQAIARATSAAESYIAGYNVWMHHVLGQGGQRLFPRDMRLITHWNLRDQIKADYSDKSDAALQRQRLLRAVMERIVTQTIPQAVIDDPRVDWDPVANTVALAPAAETETPKQGKRAATATASTEREADTRYARLLEVFQAARQLDADSPLAPTEVARRFQLDTELPEQRVEQLLVQMLSAPLIPRIGKLIEKQLGRKLEPHDVWYAGFEDRPAEEDLSKLTRQRYPTAEAYKKDIPRLLRELGFSAERARYLDAHIVVDPSRGAGHAMQSARRDNLLPSWGPGDDPHLRTRVNPDGMDYKGYNIAVHEMGHNVEQVFSLYDVDSTLLQGVPGNAFTEALAFTFQARANELLGLGKPDARKERRRVLSDVWATWEISGPALIDLRTWRWMYQHPQATPAELREAVLGIAREVWNRWYAPVLGGQDSPLLGIYSHMISSVFYLPYYPLGHLIAFQLEQKLQGPQSGAEFERVAKFGRVTPDLWMEHATGRPVIAEPLLEAGEAALRGEEGQ